MYQRYHIIVPFTEICTYKVCKMFLYKYTETMEKGKNEPSFYEKRQRHEYNWRFVRIKKKKIQGIIFK